MSKRRDGARNFFPMPQKIFNLGMNAGEIAVYRESNRSNRTINRILSTVHSFYQYQADMHEIDNPIYNIYKAERFML